MIDFKDAAEDLARRLPRATRAVVAGASHLAPLEAPAEFRRLVLDALA